MLTPDMKKAIKHLTVSVLVLLSLLNLCSCNNQPKRFTKEEIIAYSQTGKSGWSKGISVAGVKYDVSYRHPSLIFAIEDDVDSLIEGRDSLLRTSYWFNIDISIDGFNQSPLRYQLSSLEEYNMRLDYFLNRAIHDVWLEDGKDTFRPTSYWFENNHNLIARETIVLGFDNREINGKTVQLAFNDRLFRNGIIKANFQKEDLDKNIIVTD
jgi:hypothetical protein